MDDNPHGDVKQEKAEESVIQKKYQHESTDSKIGTQQQENHVIHVRKVRESTEFTQ